MVAGLRRVFRAAVAIFCIALALPALALAHGGGKCNASACKVYVEPNAPSAGKQQAPPPQQQPTSSAGGGSGSQTNQPSNLSRVLAHAGNDKVPLSRLLNDSGGNPLGGGPGNVAGPGLIGAALDLGLGPLALLAILLASAAALVAHGVVQNRQRRRPSA